MKRNIKLLLMLSLFSSLLLIDKQLSYSQDKDSVTNYLLINCTVERTKNDPMGETLVKLFEYGNPIDSFITSNNGLFSFKLNLNSEFIFEVYKPNYVKKIFSVNTKIPDNISGYWKYEFVLSLFQLCPNLDIPLLKKALFNIAYNNEQHRFTPTEAYDRAYNEQFKQLLIDNTKCMDKEFQKNLTNGDTYYHQKKYNEALNFYNDAYADRNEDYVKSKIEALEKTLYLIKADSLFLQKRFIDAKEIYRLVLEKSFKDKKIMKRIVEIDRILDPPKPTHKQTLSFK